MLDHTLSFSTDTATLAIFDQEVLCARINDRGDWWIGNPLGISEVQTGDMALVGLGGDGSYRVRVTDGPLTAAERDYAIEVTATLGVRIASGRFFVGQGEALPGEGFQATSNTTAPGQGAFIPLGRGSFDVLVYCIAWEDSPRWWSASAVATTDAPPDLVVTLVPRSQQFSAPVSKPRLLGNRATFLFASATRVIGPVPGMRLATSVRKAPSGLTLAACGPCSYRPTLIDYESVSWRDRIIFRVLSVDHGTKTMTGAFEEKVGGT
jgi:hypothetical protein